MKKLLIIAGSILLVASILGIVPRVLLPAYTVTIALGIVLIVYGLRRKKG